MQISIVLKQASVQCTPVDEPRPPNLLFNGSRDSFLIVRGSHSERWLRMFVKLSMTVVRFSVDLHEDG